MRRARAWAIVALAATCQIAAAAAASPRSIEFTLDNGLQVVVLPDNRTPAVTHLIGYRVGSADEVPGKSGLAHFVEHLMFKSTRTRKVGEFARLVASVGGQENAMTTRDATIYYQRVTKPLLADVMAFEADRMANLVFDADEAAAELQVVLAERSARIEGSPFNVLSEQMDASLYQNHPYRIPSIGWAHEIAALTHEDARAFYERHYSPNNAFLVVAGDISADDVRRLAGEIYGKVASRAGAVERKRPSEPEARGRRSVELRDRRASGRSFYRVYQVPSASLATERQAESLELLLAILARGETSRLGQKLIVERGAAHGVDGGYKGLNRDIGEAAIFVSGGAALPIADVEQAIADTLEDIAQSGVTQGELDRARALLSAKRSYDWDSQLRKTRGYADALAAGLTVPRLEGWRSRLGAVSTADIRMAARLLRIERSVTGLLMPDDGSDGRSSVATTCEEGARC